jgi:NosR/NirI family transcriptional regulator, nitrite reductase regulator
MRFATILLLVLCMAASAASAGGVTEQDKIAPAAPDKAIAAGLFATTAPVTLQREETSAPGWTASAGGKVIGYIGSTWEIAGSTGYSGRPLDVLVAVGVDAKIAGARLMRHNEPVLTLGISDADITAYVDKFAGVDLAAPRPDVLKPQADLPDVISRATVSTGVIRDGILRTARTLAIARGLIATGGGIDRVGFKPLDWDGLLAAGGLTHVRFSMDEAAKALAGAQVPVPPGSGAFLDLYAGIADPPAVGRNLLGQHVYNQAMAALGPGETALLVISSGLHSHRGTAWKQSGQFDRLAIVQGTVRLVPKAGDYVFVKELEVSGAPVVKEISLFRLAKAIDATKPLRVEVTAARPAESGNDVTATIALDYALPAAFKLAPPPDPEPLWQSIWAAKHVESGIVVAMLTVLTLILFAQDWITRRPKLWRALRIGFLSFTLLVLGWGLNGQLSVVQVVAFVHSLLTQFRWETFLIEPVIFLLWGFVALGMLFWGRGVYCGWLCPFGALQELANMLAQKLGVKQIAVPQALHERLWVIKYTLFVGILALSFYSMHDALVLAEVEPFKTAISLRMIRPWPFVLFVLAILFASLFIERFYCRYLCPLGAGLAIPAKLKIFDWLKRRPQCGRECRLCETKCTVGAIDPLGRINANECVLCLRCQVIMGDAAICPVLKRRARGPEGATT